MDPPKVEPYAEALQWSQQYPFWCLLESMVALEIHYPDPELQVTPLQWKLLQVIVVVDVPAPTFDTGGNVVVVVAWDILEIKNIKE